MKAIAALHSQCRSWVIRVGFALRQNFRSSSNSGHHQTGQTGPVRAKEPASQERAARGGGGADRVTG